MRRDVWATHRLWGLFANDEVPCWEDDEDKKGRGQREGCVDQHVAEARVVRVEGRHMMGDGHSCQHLHMTLQTWLIHARYLTMKNSSKKCTLRFIP